VLLHSHPVLPPGRHLGWDSHTANGQAGAGCAKALGALEKQGKGLCLLLSRTTLCLHTEPCSETSYEAVPDLGSGDRRAGGPQSSPGTRPLLSRRHELMCPRRERPCSILALLHPDPSADGQPDHRIIEPLRLERPLRSSSPTVTPAPPCLLNHVPRCHITFFEHLQGR